MYFQQTKQKFYIILYHKLLGFLHAINNREPCFKWSVLIIDLQHLATFTKSYSEQPLCFTAQRFPPNRGHKAIKPCG